MIRRSSSTRRRRASAVELAVLGALLVAPSIAGDDFAVDRLGRFLVLAVFALSADIVWGLGGLVSFGHAIFFGWAAYAVAIAQDRGWIDAPVSLPLAVAIGVGAAVLLAVVLALFSFSTRNPLGGVYFAVVTFIIAVISERLANASSAVTGGKNGLLMSVSLTIGDRQFAYGRDFYLLAAGLLVACYLGVRMFARSRHGRDLLALRENEDRLQLLGYRTAPLKARALVLSAAVAGAAGVVYYAHDGIVSPSSVGISQSIFVLLWVLIGGVGTLLGPVVGAVALNILSAELSGRYLQTWLLVVGVLLVATLLFAPRGVLGSMQRPEDRLRRRAT